jgi:two-component system, OmpR family, sensor histidine kinase MprB
VTLFSFSGRLPIRTRLAASIGAVVAVVMLAAFAGAYAIASHELYASLDKSLIREATGVKLMYKHDGWVTPSTQCQYLVSPACSQAVSADGSSDGILRITPATIAVAKGRSDYSFTNTTISSFPGRTYAVPLAPGIAALVGLRSDGVQQSLADLRNVLLVLSAFGILLCAFLGLVVARSGLRPVRRLTEAAERVAAEQDLGYRIALAGNDELARLAGAFDEMLSQLEESVKSQRQLIADASHELRTPMTSIRTNAELLTRDQLSRVQRDTVATSLIDGVDEMVGLIGDVVDIARGEELPHEREEIRLDRLVFRRISVAERHWPAIDFRSQLLPTRIQGVPQRVDRLVANLLDNAAKFSPPNGIVEVTLTPKDDQIRLRVRDHGVGIAPEERDLIFQRFYRSTGARSMSGSGLGLAMVGQIAQSHRASISVKNAPDGGAVFEVIFMSPS